MLAVYKEPYRLLIEFNRKTCCGGGKRGEEEDVM